MLGPVELAEGVLTIVASHSGTANFVVKIVGAQGADELSINHIGRYAGARAHAVSERQIIGLQPGANRIQVEADGRWTLRLGQEFPSAGEPPSIQHQDSGDDVLSWLLLREGQYTLDASHNGSSNFVVRLIKSDGSIDSLLVNQIGSYSGEKLIQVSRRSLGINPSPGLYALAVEADGDWSVGLR